MLQPGPESRLISTQVPRSSFTSESANLDLIRAAAVLSVFFAHLHDIYFRRQSELGWHFAQMGVLIFFVHTSMVLMLSLERTKATGSTLFGSFYLRRAFRIYPLSIFCVCIAMIVQRSPELSEGVRHWRWPEFLSNLALTTNLTYSANMVGGLWTLPIEMQMYMVLPFLFVLGRRRPTIAIASIWVLAVPLALLQMHSTARLNVFSYAPCFLSGVLAWKLSLTVKRRLSGAWWPFVFVGTWAVFFLATHDNGMWFHWFFCLTLGLAIPWFEELTFKPLRVAAHYVAKYSYGIYLSHIAVMMWSFGLPVPRPLTWAVWLVLAATVPVAMFHFIENPLIRVGKRVSDRIFRPVASRKAEIAATAAP